jgi:glycosyltransferase involved in cell wall biosynthesis
MHFQPAVKPTEILGYTKSADVGLSLIENSCLSYYLTLANKVVEYIAAGVPVITTDFPEPAKIVNMYNCGWTVDAQKQAIADLINSISAKDIKEKKNNALNCRHNFNWKTEEKKLLKAYQDLGL